MQTIEILAQWVREIKINEIKCGILPKGSTENSMRCTVSQYNREHGHERGVGVHLSYFWEERAVCAVGVSFDEFIKHHKDRKYVNTWRSTAKDIFYSSSLRARKKKTNRIDTSLADTQEVIYTVNQLAEELGTTPAAIRKRIARGFIPAHKEGRKLIILKSEYVGSLRER